MGFSYAKVRKQHQQERRDLVKEIKKQHPPREFPRVADVAGGVDGDLTKLLLKAGYKVTLIDYRGMKVKGARLWKRKFLVRDHEDFDLIVGYRPCGASRKLVRVAKYKPVVLAICGCRWVWWAQNHIPKRKPRHAPRLLARRFMHEQRVRVKEQYPWFFMHGRHD